ncbi:MAG: ATPase, T2SS/T4P/T4SS family [Bacteroidetes bacterium]|nr:ATPase, T2SS/T4P/T4SS family [Bacteroidota bacterium]MDE2671397.1 ATPase, T2SS/T4P/T4SS family [Bacteroidota bacterium]
MDSKRLSALIRQYLGDQILTLIRSPEIEEVYVNPDLCVRAITTAGSRILVPADLSPQGAEAFLRAIASITSNRLDRDCPSLAAAVLQRDLGKCRIQGFIPPLTSGPAFNIRKPCRQVPSLEDYVEDSMLTQDGYSTLRSAIESRQNILVAGPTGSGKTTLCNALLKSIIDIFPEERLVILEDTTELNVRAADTLQLQTTARISMRELVKFSLRATPNRIIVGEVRDASAKSLLDAWITGHPGGCATIHGEDADKALERLSDLAREGARGIDQRHLVLRAVHIVVLITGFGRARRVCQIVRVTGCTPTGFTVENLCPLE